MSIRILQASDAAEFHALRLVGLRESPTAFSAAHEEERDRPVEEIAARMSPSDDGVVLGAFDQGELVGVLGLKREARIRLRHKIWLWGMYVAPAARRQGLGEALIAAALDHARAMDGVRQVNLGVNAANQAAHALYLKMGFKQFGLERAFMLVDGKPQDEVLMVRVLTDQ